MASFASHKLRVIISTLQGLSGHLVQEIRFQGCCIDRIITFLSPKEQINTETNQPFRVSLFCSNVNQTRRRICYCEFPLLRCFSVIEWYCPGPTYSPTKFYQQNSGRKFNNLYVFLANFGSYKDNNNNKRIQMWLHLIYSCAGCFRCSFSLHLSLASQSI